MDDFTYTYDRRGNITAVYNNGTAIKKYTYNNQNQLITEENLTMSQMTQYSYSQQGDITQKTRYIKDINGNYFKPTTKTYTYSTDGKYLLTAYNGSACVYDALGNPTTYKGKTLTWAQGKRLTSYDGLAFEYDALGRRTKKGDVTYYYDSQGRMVKSSDDMEFLYAGNELVGFIYRGATYIYCKDLFGNITAILDGSGNVVVKYDYDAWGVHRVLSNTGATITDMQHIGNINPFRYRGYYYDTETGLYYLKSRYYDPETCRFINMDSVEYADPTYLHGLNLYAYCNNNPIMYVDPNGHFPILALILGLTALVGMGLTIAGVASDNNTMTAIGLTMVAVPALISGGLAACATTGAFASWVGIGTITAGIGTGLFASAEYQECFTGNNWMINAGMNEDWYNGLMLTTAGLATLGTFASSFAYSFNINSIQKIGKVDNYYGIKFTQKALSGNLKIKTLSIHPAHNGHPVHWQLNNINPRTGTIGKRIRWDLLLRILRGK